MVRISSILEKPTIIDKNHESLYKSYHILNYVLDMVQRGDSKDTILEVVAMLRHQQIETTSEAMKENSSD